MYAACYQKLAAASRPESMLHTIHWTEPQRRLSLWELNHAQLLGVVPLYVPGGGGGMNQRRERRRDSVSDQHGGGGPATCNQGFLLLSAHRDPVAGEEQRKTARISCVVRYS